PARGARRPRRARGGTRGDAPRRGMPHVQCSRSGRAAGRRRVVSELGPCPGPKAPGRRHKGKAQPTKQSFEADRLEQLHFFSCWKPSCCYLSLRPVSSARCPPRSFAIVVRRQVAHVKHVAEVHATGLSPNGFFPCRIRPKLPADALFPPVFARFSPLRRPFSS